MTNAELLTDLDRALAATEAVVASIGAEDHLGEAPLAAFQQAAAGPGAPFAAEVPVPPDAPAVDRLAGWLGRTV